MNLVPSLASLGYCRFPVSYVSILMQVKKTHTVFSSEQIVFKTTALSLCVVKYESGLMSTSATTSVRSQLLSRDRKVRA